MRASDPVDEIIAVTMETLTTRPHVRAAAFVWDQAAPVIARAARSHEGARVFEEGFDPWVVGAREPRVVAHITGAFLAAAKVNADGAVWVLFDEKATLDRELDALAEAAKLVAAHLDQLLGPEEVGA